MKKESKTILLVGNHHTPAHELIRQLQTDIKINWDTYYLSHQKKLVTHLTNSIIPSLKPNHFFSIDSAGLDRNSILETIKKLPKFIHALIFSLRLINRLCPDIVVSFGGYISTPVIIASFIKKIPSVTHEQTLTLSLSTKINSFFATKVALSFPIRRHPKFIVTGNLLRREIFQIQSKKFTPKINPFIYITGGNQGSSVINQAIEPILPQLCQKFTLIHQTGNQPIPNFDHQNYRPQNYIAPTDIGFVLNQAQVIISRSGANICQEIAALGQKSILIPLPFSQQNEQLLNAQWLKKQLPQQTIIIPQSKISPQLLLQSIDQLLQVKNHQPQPQSKPNYKLLHLIHELVAN